MIARFDVWLGKQTTTVYVGSAMLVAFVAAAVIITGAFLIFGGR